MLALRLNIYLYIHTCMKGRIITDVNYKRDIRKKKMTRKGQMCSRNVLKDMLKIENNNI